MDTALASIPKRALAKIAAASLDATAFPTYALVHDYRVQKEVDKAIRDAIERGDPDPVPDGVILGADRKLQRCKHDPTARGARRSASSETNHVAVFLHRLLPDDPHRLPRLQPQEQGLRLGYDIAPYVLALSCDPCQRRPRPGRTRTVPSPQRRPPLLQDLHRRPEFTPRPALIEWRTPTASNTIMDYARPLTNKITKVTVDKEARCSTRSAGTLPAVHSQEIQEAPRPQPHRRRDPRVLRGTRGVALHPQRPARRERHPTVHLPPVRGPREIRGQDPDGQVTATATIPLCRSVRPSLNSGAATDQSASASRTSTSGSQSRGAPEHTNSSTPRAATA